MLKSVYSLLSFESQSLGGFRVFPTTTTLAAAAAATTTFTRGSYAT